MRALNCLRNRRVGTLLGYGLRLCSIDFCLVIVHNQKSALQIGRKETAEDCSISGLDESVGCCVQWPDLSPGNVTVSFASKSACFGHEASYQQGQSALSQKVVGRSR